jgi:hypothetical protein
LTWKSWENIQTIDIEYEIWFHYLHKFSNYNFVSNLVRNDDKKIQKIVILTKQAQDYYVAYRQVSDITKPVLLFYSFERLASLLLNFKMSGIHIGNHGVSFDEQLSKVKIEQKGLFPVFHTIYSNDNSMIINESSFLLKDLINSGPITEKDLAGSFHRETDELKIRIDTLDGQQIVIHELDREFLFMFSLSSLARYHVVKWSRLLEGKNDDLAINLQRYLYSIRLFFPILICSYILDRKLYFPFHPFTVYSLDEWYNNQRINDNQGSF